MTVFCLDASSVIARLLDENLSESFRNFWRSLDNSTDHLVSAEILRPECTSVIRAAVARERISEEQGQLILNGFLALPVSIAPDSDQFRRALQLASRFKLSKAYDMQYLAVAEMSGATLITCDRRQASRAQELGIKMRLFG